MPPFTPFQTSSLSNTNPFINNNTTTSTTSTTSTTINNNPFLPSSNSTGNNNINSYFQQAPSNSSSSINPFVKATQLSSNTSNINNPFITSNTNTTSSNINNPFMQNSNTTNNGGGNNYANVSFGITNNNNNNGNQTNSNNNPFTFTGSSSNSTTNTSSPFTFGQNTTNTNTNNINNNGCLSQNSNGFINPFASNNNTSSSTTFTNPNTSNNIINPFVSNNNSSNNMNSNVFSSNNNSNNIFTPQQQTNAFSFGFGTSNNNNNSNNNVTTQPSPFSSLNTTSNSNFINNNTTNINNPFISNSNSSSNTNIFSSSNNLSQTNGSQISFGFKPQTQSSNNTATFGFVPSSQPNQSLPQTQTNSFPSSQNPFYYPQNNQQPQISSFGFTPQQNSQPNLFQYIPQQTIQQISYIQYTPQNVSTTLFTPRTLEEIEKQFLFTGGSPSISSLINSLDTKDNLYDIRHRHELKEYFSTRDNLMNQKNYFYEKRISQAPYSTMKWKKNKSHNLTKNKNMVSNRLGDHFGCSLTTSQKSNINEIKSESNPFFSQTQTFAKRPNIFKNFSSATSVMSLLDNESEIPQPVKDEYEICITLETPIKINKIYTAKQILNVKIIKKEISDLLRNRGIKFNEDELFLFMNGKNINNSVELIDLSKEPFSINKITKVKLISIIAYCGSYKNENIKEEEFEDDIDIKNNLGGVVNHDIFFSQEKNTNSNITSNNKDIPSNTKTNNDNGTVDFYPKCTKYKTNPSIDELRKYSKTVIESFPNFVIYNQYALIKFLDKIDLTYVNLDDISIQVNGNISFTPSKKENDNLNKIKVHAVVELFDSYIDESNEDMIQTVRDFCKENFKSSCFSYDKENAKLIIDVDLKNI